MYDDMVFYLIKDTIDRIIKEYKDSIPPIAIFPFGKDGMETKSILNNGFGIKEKYIIDNGLANINPHIFKDVVLKNITEKTIVIISTTDAEINRLLVDRVVDNKNDNLNIFNIRDNNIRPISDNMDYCIRLKELLHAKKVKNKNYIRVGRNNDGGYVMIDDFDENMCAYSFGISDDMSWDKMINQMTGMDVFMYDHTIPCAPEYRKGCYFIRCGVGVENTDNLRTLDYILNDSAKQINHKTENAILKMDIEGGEWDVIKSVSKSLLSQFRQMLFEFHGLTNKSNEEKIIESLGKLNETHQVAWIHGNNYRHAIGDDRIVVPDTIEVLYVNKNIYSFEDGKMNLPLVCDMPNMRLREDFDMSCYC